MFAHNRQAGKIRDREKKRRREETENYESLHGCALTSEVSSVGLVVDRLVFVRRTCCMLNRPPVLHYILFVSSTHFKVFLVDFPPFPSPQLRAAGGSFGQVEGDHGHPVRGFLRGAFFFSVPQPRVSWRLLCSCYLSIPGRMFCMPCLASLLHDRLFVFCCRCLVSTADRPIGRPPESHLSVSESSS